MYKLSIYGSSRSTWQQLQPQQSSSLSQKVKQGWYGIGFEKGVFKALEWRRAEAKPYNWLWQFPTMRPSAETRTLIFFLSVSLYCVTEGYPSCGPYPKEVVAILLLLALLLTGSGHENLFGRVSSLMLSAWAQKLDLIFLSIVTDLCICTEYVKHTKCFISLPKSQDVVWNHLLFPSVHFYLCWFFSRTETLASRHRAASSVSSHFSSAVSPE